MMEQQPCPHCGRAVSDAVTYIFIPSENLRWHSLCWEATHPQAFEDQKEKETQ